MEPSDETVESEKQKIALGGVNAEALSYLPLQMQARFHPHQGARERVCKSIFTVPSLDRKFDPRPGTLPCTRDDLQDFLNHGLASCQGYWSVYWVSDAKSGKRNWNVVYPDGFRSVLVFRTFEFMIRPTRDYKNTEPLCKKLHIGWRDVQDCLTKAVESNASGPMKTVTGMGYAEYIEVKNNKQGIVKVKFEWRLDRADENKVRQLIQRWRNDLFGGASVYRKEKKEYDHPERYIQPNLAAPQSGNLSHRQDIPPSHPEQARSQAQPSPFSEQQSHEYIQQTPAYRQPPIGFPSLQYADHEAWTPPQPDQQMFMEQPSAQGSRQRTHAGSMGAQSGSGHGNRPPGFPPEQQATHYGETQRLPLPYPLAEPELDPAYLQAATTPTPAGESYPFSVPPATQPMSPGLISWLEDGPADTESGEDEYQYPYEDVSDPVQYSRSPSPEPGDPPVFHDAYWGGSEFDED